MAHRSMAEVLQERAREEPARVAFELLKSGEEPTAKLTYGQLDEGARAIAARLGPGGADTRQALLLYRPGLEFITGFWGCLYAGVAPVPIYPPRPNQSLGRLHAVVADAKATLALTSAAVLPKLLEQASQDPRLAELEWLATDDVPASLAAGWQPPQLAPESLAFLQYTSGSTGAPSGVMVSHGNLLANSEYLRQCFELSPDSVSVTWLPSFHDMGLVDGILQPIYSGFLGVIIPPPVFLQSPVLWLQAITRYRATHCGGPNFGFELCARKVTEEQRRGLDLSSWVSAYNGAEPVSRATLERFATAFEGCGFRMRHFYPCYGMAESTLIITGGRVADEPRFFPADAAELERGRAVRAEGEAKVRHLVGCGHAWLDTRVLIVDPATRRPVEDGVVGEIWASGSGVAQGYWRAPDRTEETFGAHLADSGEGPFLRTGDLGFALDGELYVTGRIKDLIIVRGENHYPQDLEATAQAAYEGFRVGCGAAFTVERAGEERLIVVQEVDRTKMKGFDVVAATKAVRRAIADEHGVTVHEAVFIRVGTMPKTSSGKIQRRACKRAYLDGALDRVGGGAE